MERQSNRRKAANHQTPVLELVNSAWVYIKETLQQAHTQSENVVDHVVPYEVILDDESKKEKIKCSYCCKLFNTIEKHEEHTCRKINDFLLKCVSCKKRYVDHCLQENTGKKSNAEECQSGNAVESSGEHPTTEHSYQCCVCYKTYSDLSFTARHIKYHVTRQAAVAGPALHCGECSKTFATKQQLCKHSTVHTDVRPFKCTECDKWFKTQDNVKRHMYVHNEERPFACPTCGKEFRAKHMLKKHEETHDEKRFYECPQCNKKYKAKNSLRDHLLVHSGQRPYKCQQCDQAFYRRSHLATHRVVHSKLKPFSCKDCDKSFGRREHLKVHERIHSGEKPFSCNLCDRSFNQQAGLQAHLVSHSEDRPFSCTKCTKTFKYPSQVKHHSCKPEVELSMVCVRGNRGEIVTLGDIVDEDLSERMPSSVDGECASAGDEANPNQNPPHSFNASNTIILIQIQDPIDEAAMLNESLSGTHACGSNDGECTRNAGQGENTFQDGGGVMERGHLHEESTAYGSGYRASQGMIVGGEHMREILEKI